MKSLFLTLLAAVFIFTGCAQMQQLYPAPPVEQQICYLKPAMTLCKVSAGSGFSLEQWKDFLLDATLVPVAANQITGEEAYNIMNDIVTRLEDPNSQVTTNGLLAYIVDKYDLNPAAVLLVKRRLDRLAVPVVGDLVLDKDSLDYILQAFREQRDQFAMFFPKTITNH